MDSIEVIIILLVVLGIAGVVAYYIYDYVNNKKNIADEISNTNKSLKEESNYRLGNLAYVVNQVNNVNSDIYTTVTSNINRTNINTNTITTLSSSNVLAFNNINSLNSSLNSANTNLNNLNVYNTSLNSNLDKSFKFSTTSTPGLVSFYNLPGGIPNPNINLMNKLITTMGITANNLTPANNTQFCGAIDGSGNLVSGADCVKFPNANGDTYIAPLTSTNSVVLKGPVNILPQATSSSGGTASPAILVDAGGNLIVNSSIQFKSATGSTISLTNDGTNLNITGGPVQINPTATATSATTTAANSIKIEASTGSSTLPVLKVGNKLVQLAP